MCDLTSSGFVAGEHGFGFGREGVGVMVMPCCVVSCVRVAVCGAFVWMNGGVGHFVCGCFKRVMSVGFE